MLVSHLFILGGLTSLSAAGYVLQDDYSPSSFFSMFDFFTEPDPTHGFVNYVDQFTAQRDGLINNEGGKVYIGVDSTKIASGSGRNSVRLTSKKSYNHGLIILDLTHMPGGICGAWPAFWTVGPGWPNSGEIDIIEGVNSQLSNSVTLHTGDGCTISDTGTFTGLIATPNCNINAAGQATNAGCSISTPNRNTYGIGFNAAQGGVYATEWTSEAISVWFFTRGAIPSDITEGKPDPSSWGMATAHFSGGCDIDDHFKDQQIVFDTTFCGDWAGNVWSTDPVCSSKAATCQSFVQNNPSAFRDAYWSVNSLKVYSNQGGVSPSSVSNPKPSNPQDSVSVSASIPPLTIATSIVVPTPNPVPAGSTTTAPTGGQQTQTSRRHGGGRHSRTWGGMKDAGFFAVPTQTTLPATVSNDISGPTDRIAAPTIVAATEAQPLSIPQELPSHSEVGSDNDLPPLALAVDGSVIVQVAVPTATPLINDSKGALPIPQEGQQNEYATVSALRTDDFPKPKQGRDEAVEAHEGRRAHVHRHVHQDQHKRKFRK